MRVLSLVVLLAIMPIQANAGFTNGNDLIHDLKQCDAKDEQPAYACGVARGYIEGVHDSTENETCTPMSLTLDELIPVVRKIIEDNPADSHYMASSIVKAAILEAWPCPE
jgi:hypothetical protein